VVRNIADAKRYNLQSGTSAPIYFLGHGFRSNQAAAEFIAKKLGAIVVVGKLTSERFFHADTALGILPDGVTFYSGAFAAETRSLLHYLYPGKVHEVSSGEADKLATNGRLVRFGPAQRSGPGQERFGYFYTEGAFGPRFFEKLAKRYPGSTLKARKVTARGTTFVEHELRYRVDGVEKKVVFVPMPESQAVLGSGSVSCTTLLTADGKSVVMVPPDNYELSVGHNPAEDAAAMAGGVNRQLALKEYGLQKARFEHYGIKVHELAPTKGLHEQIYTRDTGYFFRRDRAGRAWDPTFGPAGGKSVFLEATLRHPARRPESAAIREGLWGDQR
jgi:hypothetical protein